MKQYKKQIKFFSCFSLAREREVGLTFLLCYAYVITFLLCCYVVLFVPAENARRCRYFASENKALETWFYVT